VNKDWEFVSMGTEISLGKFVSEYFTPLILDLQTSVVSTEVTDEIWETEKEEAIEKVRGRVRIILLEFKRTRDSGECYFQDMWKVTEKEHTHILTVLRTLVGE
jgi:hypothetical protein